jgi:glucose/arabinose dehydrogenase
MRLRSIAPLIGAALLAACASAGTTQPAAPLATLAPGASAGQPAAPTAAPADTPAPAPTSAPAPAPSSAPAEPAALDALSLGIAPLLEGFSRPTHVTGAGDGSGRLFVTEQAGRVLIVRDGERLERPFLDIIPLVGANGNEQGLLSVAFHPSYAENGIFFVYYTARDGANTVARYRVSADPDVADAASAAVLMAIDDPAPNHNGGLLKFGPDGMLYIGTGDGGAAGDPWGNGQSLDTLLGKILRVDVDGGDPYAIPADNPFADGQGARPEIWAYGLRNPWRFSFDRATGDLFIADVGQNEFEEVHFQPAGTPGGRNYGWDTMEANACFERSGCDQAGLELPVAAYTHSSREGGCSITGGYVYRGAQFPQLVGTYLYADFCSGNLWALRPEGDAWQSRLVTAVDIRTSSFGEDEAGELYLTDRDGGGLYRLVVE